VTTLSTITPSSTRWGDRVEEDRLTHSSDSEGDETQCPWTSSEWVTGPPSIATVSEQSEQTESWCYSFRASEVDEEEQQGTTEA
jgi:hypothetical protein